MFANWKLTTSKTKCPKAVAEENEKLKQELEIVKKQLEHETSLLEEEKSILAEDDDSNITDKLLHSEQARRNLEQENEIIRMELFKARKQLEDAAKTLKILSSTKMPYVLLNSLFFPPLRSYAMSTTDKKTLFQGWHSVAALAVPKRSSLADVIVFYQCGIVAGMTRDAKNIVWRAKIDSTICHAVVDERRGLVYYSAYFLFPGIYSVSINKLEACRSLKKLTPSIKTQTLLEYPHWIFRGLAVDEERDLLYCCAKFCGSKNGNFMVNYKVGIWDLATMKSNSDPVFFIEYDPSTIYLCQPFQPYYCSIYRPSKTQDGYDTVLAVSDWRNSRILIFLVDSVEQHCKILQTVASEGTAPGSVKGPCALQFDRFGNLVVAESDNRRLQLFAARKTDDGSTIYEPKWLSENYKSSVWSVASSFSEVDAADEESGTYSDELTDILYVGLNDSGKVIHVNTPCFE